MPQWERECWRDAFALYGPLDWKRTDLLFARVNQFQSVGGDPLKDFILFRDPGDPEPGQTVEEKMAALGWRGE